MFSAEVAGARAVDTDEEQCSLRWDEFAAAARPAIHLSEWPRDALSDDCPAVLGRWIAGRERCVAPTCERAGFADGRRGILLRDGPGGSGRFVWVGLVVEGEGAPRFACMTGSTVGWRHLHAVADELGPLPWLEDLDDDGAAEVIIWHRLPWGDSESSQALIPAVYQLEGERLVRRDEKGRALAARIAGAYRKLVQDRAGPAVLCYAAVARALERWGAG